MRNSAHPIDALRIACSLLLLVTSANIHRCGWSEADFEGSTVEGADAHMAVLLARVAVAASGSAAAEPVKCVINTTTENVMPHQHGVDCKFPCTMLQCWHTQCDEPLRATSMRFSGSCSMVFVQHEVCLHLHMDATVFSSLNALLPRRRLM